MNDMRQPQPAWTVAQAREVYNTARWGGGYFDIDDSGRVRVRSPRRPNHPGVDLSALAEEARAAGYGLPVLARFVTPTCRNSSLGLSPAVSHSMQMALASRPALRFLSIAILRTRTPRPPRCPSADRWTSRVE